MGLNFKGDPTKMSGPLGDFFRDIQDNQKNGPQYTPEQQAKMITEGVKMKAGGKVSSASARADGCATKGKTRGKMV